MLIAAGAQWVVVCLGLWLVGLGVFMFMKPRHALDALASMGGSDLIHFGEMGLRTLAGLALVLASPLSRHPMVSTYVGSFLIVSAAILAILPRRWHAAYSTWWARRIPAPAVRLIAPLSIVGGLSLIWLIFG